MSPAAAALRLYEGAARARRSRADRALAEPTPADRGRRSVRNADVRPRVARGAVAQLRARRRHVARPSLAYVALGAVALVAIAVLLVWVRLQVVDAGYELSTGRRVEQRLEQEQRELDLEIATLTSPPRLERVARERLGMKPPAPGQIVTAP